MRLNIQLESSVVSCCFNILSIQDQFNIPCNRVTETRTCIFDASRRGQKNYVADLSNTRAMVEGEVYWLWNSARRIVHISPI